MKKRICSFLLVFVMLLSTQVHVFAIDKLELVSAYALGERLYVYADPGEKDTSTVKADVQLNDSSIGQRETPTALTNADKRVTYLFLIDLSGSMRSVKSNVEKVISSILDEDECNASVTLATFGEKFQVALTNGVDEKTVVAKLNEFKYNENWTNPYDGLIQAYDYLETQPRMAGELINLVLITDGTPAIKGSEKEKLQEQMAEVASRISGTSSVIFHTVGLKEWKQDALDVFSKGTGIDVNIQGSSAVKCGQEIAEFVNNLDVFEYNIAQFKNLKTFDIILNVTDSTMPNMIYQIDWKNVQVLGSGYIPGIDGSDNPPIIIPGNTEESPIEPDNTEGETDTSGTESTEDSTDSEEETQGTENNSETENIGNTGNSDKTEENSGSEDKSDTQQGDANGKDDKEVTSIILIGGGAAVLFIVLIIVFLMRRNSSSKAGGTVVLSEHAVQMRLVMLSGTCQNKKDMFYLQDELWIGSSKQCDIILNSKEVAPKNSRIFIREGVVYIEDINSASGTCIDGMRIYAVNRLRSGDVISIGNTSFRFMF